MKKGKYQGKTWFNELSERESQSPKERKKKIALLVQELEKKKKKKSNGQIKAKNVNEMP